MAIINENYLGYFRSEVKVQASRGEGEVSSEDRGLGVSQAVSPASGQEGGDCLDSSQVLDRGR